MRVLVTGGAGFIGSHIVDGLISKGHSVRVMDCLDPQVHGPGARKPGYLNPKAEFVQADVRIPKDVDKALDGMEAVYHEAAAVGVGQSMYQIRHYTELNAMGCATLLEGVVARKNQIQKMIVASSMSIYGEGKYLCGHCGPQPVTLRPESQLQKKEWELKCPNCGMVMKPLPTDEKKPIQPTSIYAIGKRDHEEMVLSIGAAYKIPAVALRYFNVYGTRQALSNPYTGVAAIFSSRLLNKKAPIIYEDGLQSRDFVHVSDIVQANLLALENPKADHQVFNVGSGEAQTIKGVAEVLARELGLDIRPQIEAKFRAGDVRHCFSDITKISSLLGYKPTVRFKDGVKELISWVRKQSAEDHSEEAARELKERGLTS